MRRPLAAPLAAAFVLAAVPSAHAEVRVDAQFQAFAPSELDVLPGETVEWVNISSRAHTVTADDETFDSGEIEGGDRFEMAFTAPGLYEYHCRLHAGMVGEVDVRRVTMGRLPLGLVQAGERVGIDGRAADPAAPVEIERSIDDGPFERVATVAPGPDGTWQTDVVAEKSADYRARTGADVSDTRRLLVSDRRVIVIARRGRVFARVVPANPYQRVMLELKLRDRFGWWPQQFKRLDYLSRVRFRVRRAVRARVSLVDRDGWTRLAISKVVRVRRAKR
jgi:plastocyanin